MRLRVWRKGTWQWVDVVDSEVPGGGSFSGNLSDLTINVDKDWGAKKITNLAAPAASGDATNKGAVDTLLALKAALASPTFTGVPAAPTAAVGTNTTQLATTAFVIANPGGAGALSGLTIDADKDWQAKSISNMLELDAVYVTSNSISPYSGSTILLGGHINPSLDVTYDLGGNSGNAWRNIAGNTLVGITLMATNSLGAYSGSSIALTANLLPTTLTYALGDSSHILAGVHAIQDNIYYGSTAEGSIFGSVSGIEIQSASNKSVLISTVGSGSISLYPDTGKVQIDRLHATAWVDIYGNYVAGINSVASLVISGDTNKDVTVASNGTGRVIIDHMASTHSTPSRSLATVYENTNGAPLMVTVSVYLDGGGGATSPRSQAMIGSTSSPATVVGDVAIGTSHGSYSQMTFIVPVNWYYKVVEAAATVSIVLWSEWLLGK